MAKLMLYTTDYLFLHYPKTAGKTLSRAFLASWEKPIKGLISKGQLKELEDLITDKVDLQLGRGHENLITAEKIMRDDGISVEDLKAIFVCIRNPYDLAVSTYFFMRETHHNNKDKENFQLAARVSLEDFWLNAKIAAKPQQWFRHPEKSLHNIELIKFENLAAEMQRIGTKYGFRVDALDHLNASKRGHYREYMTSKVEPVIYNKFNFLFEIGGYPRESF